MKHDLTVVHCAMGGNQQNVDFLRPIIDKLDMKLVTISEWPTHDVLWKRDTWLAELAKADIIVCPQRHNIQPAKSNNRVTQAQSLGIPVCASPLMAYTECVTHGETGFICDTDDEWEQCLSALRDDGLRSRIGAAGKDAARAYSIDEIGSGWNDLLFDLCVESCNPPKVDIIIPSWNNLRYLQECIKSIQANTYYPYNIIVVNSGSMSIPEWVAKQDVIYYNNYERLHFSAAVNIGLRISKERYVCILNDDTIVAKHWLTALMHEAVKPGVGAVNPWSNCDRGWLHNEAITVGGVELVPGMAYDTVRPIIPKLYDLSHDKVVTKREWLAFFCTVIPRPVIDLVGFLDEDFKSGCEDLDYCRRIQRHGYKFVTTDDSVVFHFGGATRKQSVAMDAETHQQEDAANHAILAKKYQTFIIYTGPGWEKWSPKSLDRGIGGSETCVIYVARELARRGHNVTVYGDPGDEAGVYDGVRYVPYDSFSASVSCDVFIASRVTDIFTTKFKASKRFCWIHDIWLFPDRSINVNKLGIDKFLVLSPWHQEFFCDHHSVPISKTYVTRNGIDLSRFKDSERVSGRMVYSSSADRGLDVLLECLPRIRERVPTAHIKIFYGFDTWKKAIVMRNNPDEVLAMRKLESMMQQPGVEYVGRVGQSTLASELAKAELWAYPTGFWETFCITAVEMMAAGVPIVTSDLAALHTTVGDVGYLIRGSSDTKEYQDIFVDKCCELLTDHDEWERLSVAGLEAAKKYTWESLVDTWFTELFN